MTDTLTLSDLAAAAVAKDERVTLEQLEAAIAKTEYHVFPNTCLTVCVLTLPSGFTVSGESACAVPANFNQGLGERLAYEQAVRKLWSFMGFALCERRHQEALERARPDEAPAASASERAEEPEVPGWASVERE